MIKQNRTDVTNLSSYVT